MAGIIAATQDRTGSNANIGWRAIGMGSLRSHPLYRALPLARDIVPATAKSLGLFRQDTWQWDALHRGRLTTSKLACCLGLYESFASSVLEIPRSLQSHSRAVAAYQQLMMSPVTDYAALTEQTGVVHDHPAAVWTAGERFRFVPDPAVSNSYDEGCIISTSASRARLAWGSAQEATAILAALNYFCNLEPGTTVGEAGMYTFEALYEDLEHRQYLDQQAVLRDILGTAPGAPNLSSQKATSLSSKSTKSKGHAKPSKIDLSIKTSTLYEDVTRCIYTDRSLPLLGASPDGVIFHADGRVEALEVKCVSPFVDIAGESSSSSVVDDTPPAEGERATMRVVEGYSKNRPGSKIKAGFGVWHVPQLQLEMFCVGAHCRSAVIVVLSISGARIYRVQRDDEYIAVMLELVRQFYMQYISSVPRNRRKPPPPNFFNPRENAVYAAFLRRTIELAEGAELVKELRGEEVQRSAHNDKFFL